MTTPSEVVPCRAATPYYWEQVSLVDSAVFGGVVGGAWNVAIRCMWRFGRTRQKPNWDFADNVRDVYLRVGVPVRDTLDGVGRIVPMDNSSARVVINDLPCEVHRLDYVSQIAPLATREVKMVT